MEEKTFSVKKRFNLYHALSWLGVAIALFGFLMDSSIKPIFTWAGLGLLLLAIIFRFTMVRCPHCGNHLTEHKHAPAKCPGCGKELN